MPAPILKQDCSLSTLLDEACFTHARFEAKPLTLAHAAEFDPFFVTWPKCNEQEIKLHTALVRLNALIIACDEELNEIADAVNQAVLLEGKSDRASALYLRYFGDQPVGQLKRPILSTQLEKMRGWIPSLTASKSVVLSALGARLGKAVTAADATIASRLLFEQRNRDFRSIGERKALVDSLNALRKALYGKLSELPHAHPELHLPATFAEQFFRHEGGKKVEPALTVEELKQAITESKAQTGLLEAELVTALADAAQIEEAQREEDEAVAALALADEARAAAAARLAALSARKKSGSDRVERPARVATR